MHPLQWDIMSKGTSKAKHLLDMERYYIQGRYTDQEMANKLGVERTTAWRYRKILEDEILFAPLQLDETGRYYIDRSQYISQIRVNLNEALILYLAVRHFSQQTQIAQPHVKSGLEKLAAALHRPMTQRLVQTAAKIELQSADPNRVKALETIAKAWAENSHLRIQYRALSSNQLKTHHVKPYLIEPSHWSDSVYLIGYSDLNKGIVAFKISRIEKAIPTSFEVEDPDPFDEQTLLQHAWGIWMADKEPVTVRLRFAKGRATKRVKESMWHPLEKVVDLEDGGCEWSAEITEWKEMLPFIRSWGADCEVLEPAKLRRELEREVMRLMDNYGIQGQRYDIPESDDDAWADTLFGEKS